MNGNGLTLAAAALALALPGQAWAAMTEDEIAAERAAIGKEGLRLQGRYVQVENSGMFSSFSLSKTDPAKVAEALQRCDQTRVGIKDVAMANGKPFLLTPQMFAGDLLIFAIPDEGNSPVLMVLDKDERTLMGFTMLKRYKRIATADDGEAVQLRHHERDRIAGGGVGQTLNLAKVTVEGAEVLLFETYFSATGKKSTPRRTYAACPM